MFRGPFALMLYFCVALPTRLWRSGLPLPVRLGLQMTVGVTLFIIGSTVIGLALGLVIGPIAIVVAFLVYCVIALGGLILSPITSLFSKHVPSKAKEVLGSAGHVALEQLAEEKPKTPPTS